MPSPAGEGVRGEGDADKRIAEEILNLI